jgi:preprotein translocase YajC subunit
MRAPRRAPDPNRTTTKMHAFLLTLAQAAPAQPMPWWRAWLPLIGMMAVFYFILIRPRQQEMKRHAKMVSELQRGDTVITAGGIIGEIQSIKDNQITMRSATSTFIVERSRVSRKAAKGEGK